MKPSFNLYRQDLEMPQHAVEPRPLTKSVPKKSEEELLQAQTIDYIKREFIHDDSSISLAVRFLWGINYRLNYWKDGKIVKSDFMQFEKTPDGFLHKVLRGDRTK